MQKKLFSPYQYNDQIQIKTSVKYIAKNLQIVLSKANASFHYSAEILDMIFKKYLLFFFHFYREVHIISFLFISGFTKFHF